MTDTMISDSNYVCGRVIKCEAITEEILDCTKNAENHILPEVLKESLNKDSIQITHSIVVQLESIDVDQLSSSKSLKELNSPSTNQVELPLRNEDKDWQFSCHLCNKSYKNRKSLYSHTKKHKEIVATERVVCNICGKSLVDQRGFIRHMRIHTGEKPYKCEICNRRFSDIGELKTHVRTHTGERPYKCEICNLRFVRSCNLKSHVHTHSGEKPFHCKVCEKSFSTSSIRNRHMKTHSRNKSYFCGYCDNSYIYRHHLKRHEITHFKTFQCSECKSSFTIEETLNDHMQRKHMVQIKAYSCNVCDRSFSFKQDLQAHEKLHYQYASA